MMLESWLTRWLPVGRMCHGLSLGQATIDVVFARPGVPAEAASAAAMRLAEELAAAAGGWSRSLVRVAALPPSGRPVALVEGREGAVRVSVSHVAGLLGAAASLDGSVGLDIVDPTTAGCGLDVFLSPEELALLPDHMGLARGLLWAAKEAAFKAARLDVGFRPRAIAIESLSPEGFTWTLTAPHACVVGAGGFAVVAGHVVAVATAEPVASRRAVTGGRSAREEPAACS